MFAHGRNMKSSVGSVVHNLMSMEFINLDGKSNVRKIYTGD
jgi:hypothetical protein